MTACPAGDDDKFANCLECSEMYNKFDEERTKWT